MGKNKKPVRRILRKLSKLVSLKKKGGKEKKPYQQIVGGELVTVVSIGNGRGSICRLVLIPRARRCQALFQVRSCMFIV